MAAPLFAGTSIDQFIVSGDVSDVTQTGDAWCDVRVQAVDGASNYFDTPDLGVALRNHWFCFRHVNDMAGTTTGRRNIAWELVDANGVGVVRVFRAGAVGTNDVFQRWNGSAWVNIGSAGAVVNYADIKIDIYCKLDASGELSLYRNGILMFQETGDFSSYADPRRMRHGRYQSGNNSGTMEMMISTESLIGVRFSYDVPESDGANTAWTGTYADVDETVLDNTDYIYTGSAGNRETVKSATRASKVSTKEVKAVVISHSSAKGFSGGPTKIATTIRKGGVDYDNASDQSLIFGFKGYQQIWENDPSTGIPWTPTDAADANLEYGVKAVA